MNVKVVKSVTIMPAALIHSELSLVSVWKDLKGMDLLIAQVSIIK